jgi:hypothetical protein
MNMSLPHLSLYSALTMLALSSSSLAAEQAAPRRPVFAGVATRGTVDPTAVEAIRLELARLFSEQGVKVVVPVAEAVSEKRKARAIAELDERLDAAAKAFQRNDYAEGSTAAVEALAIFEEALAYTDDDAGWARYRELLLLVGEAQLNARDTEALAETLGQLLVIEPDYKPQKKQITTALLTQLDLVKDNQRATPQVILELKSRPPGANVLVDGRRAGRAPVAVEVLPGIHYVRLEDSAGKAATERVVVGPDGGRVTARLGSPEAAAAKDLTRLLRDPMTKRDFIEAASDVADITLAVVVSPWGPTQQVVVARVTNGELDAVIGTRLPLREGPRERALFQLVEGAMKKPADAWVGGVDDAEGLLRPEFLQGAGDPNATVKTEDEPMSIPLLIGGIIGGTAVVAGVAFGVFTVVTNEQRKDEGFVYTVDTSAFE